MLIFSRLISSQYFLIKDIKQLMSGGGIIIVAQTVIPQLTTLFS
ncbi:MAG: Maff2 family mobile element protein [Blautia faecis]